MTNDRKALSKANFDEDAATYDESSKYSSLRMSYDSLLEEFQKWTVSLLLKALHATISGRFRTLIYRRPSPCTISLLEPLAQT